MLSSWNKDIIIIVGVVIIMDTVSSKGPEVMNFVQF